jgi:hypothetical protein
MQYSQPSKLLPAPQPAQPPAKEPAPATAGDTGAPSAGGHPPPEHYVAYPPDTATDAMNRAAERATEATEAARLACCAVHAVLCRHFQLYALPRIPPFFQWKFHQRHDVPSRVLLST